MIKSLPKVTVHGKISTIHDKNEIFLRCCDIIMSKYAHLLKGDKQ